MSQVTHISDDSFDSEVLKSNVPVLLDFWAEWCGPCKAIAPKLEELSQSYAGKVKIVKLNVDDNSITPSKFSVRGIPTLIMFKNGKQFDQLVGNHPKESIEDLIKKAIR